MQQGLKSASLIIAIVIGVVVGAYMLDVKQAANFPVVAAIPSPASGQKTPIGPIQPGAALPFNHPFNHPSVNQGSQQAVQEQTAQGQHGAEGKTGQEIADPNAKFTHFDVGNSNVKSIYIDGKFVWIGTSSGVIRYDASTDSHRLYDTRNGLLSNGMFWVGKLDDRIAVGTYGGGLSLYDEANDAWDNINIANGLADAFVYGVLKADNGDIWIATGSGANRIRGGGANLKEHSSWDTFTVKNTNGGLPNDRVYGLAQGKNGEIWLSTEGGLSRFKDGKWQNWNHSKGQGAPIEKVKNDSQFGNDPAKVSSQHARQKVEMGLKDINVAYNPNYIISMQVDRDGVVWCGTWGGGLARFDGKQWHNYTMSDGLPGNHIFMLHYDQDGVLWIGTNNGVARFDGSKFTILTADDVLFSNAVFSMATAQDGTTRWIGSFGGVARLTGLK